MSTVGRGVLVVVDDATLGGTLRSAITAARAWHSAGYQVSLLPMRGAPGDRLAGLDSGMGIVDDLTGVPWDEIDLVHLHHLDWTKDRADRIGRLVAAAAALPTPPPLLSQNVFAVPDGVLGSWPGPRAVSVLGRWAAMQYRGSCGPGAPRPFVVPNGQDTSWFRPAPATAPGAGLSGLNRLGLASGYVLRVGSPLEGKWSRDYLNLADAAAARSVQLVCVGAPPGLAASMRTRPGVRLIDPVHEETVLRELYWGAQVLSVSADRGESFGNVIMEAMLCGTPVAYRARPLRDNTPWEFQGIPLFAYTRGGRSWIRASLHVPRFSATAVAESVSLITSRYGIAAVGATLDGIARKLLMARSRGRVVIDAPPGPSGDRPGPGQRAAVHVVHNPLVWNVRAARARTQRRGSDHGAW